MHDIGAKPAGSIGAGYSATMVSSAPPKPIPENLEIVGKLISELGELMTVFERELEPIVEPRAPAISNGQPRNSPVPTSPIASRLDTYAAQLQSIIRDVSDLRSRVQV